LAMAWNTLYQWIGYCGARAWDERRLQIYVQKQGHRSQTSERAKTGRCRARCAGSKKPGNRK
jgi:hypothetical protein